MRIVIIGAGNVATHLAKAFDKRENVVQVYSRKISNAKALSQSLTNASATDDISQLLPDADVYIISVKDDAIADIANNTSATSGLWVHTSGSVPIDVLKKRFDKCGVLYPLQTFSRAIAVNITEAPFFIEGCDEPTTRLIENLAKKLSDNIYHADSDQRRKLHAAAVFGCNFTNHMWAQAYDILRSSGYDFKILEPLIKATIEKALTVSPTEAQTGPARRGDKKTMLSHEKILSEEQAELYKILSQSIMKKYNID